MSDVQVKDTILERLFGDRAEMVGAILMSLAALSTAWCAYQSNLWGTYRLQQLGVAGGMTARAEELRIQGFQIVSIHAQLFVDYQVARANGNLDSAAEIRRFFPEALEVAVQDWEEAYASGDRVQYPFLRDSYEVAQWTEASQLVEDAEAPSAQADRATDNSAAYVLNTVLLAAVLFFTSVGPKFNHERTRMLMSMVGWGMFLIATFRIIVLDKMWALGVF